MFPYLITLAIPMFFQNRGRGRGGRAIMTSNPLRSTFNFNVFANSGFIGVKI